MGDVLEGQEVPLIPEGCRAQNKVDTGVEPEKAGSRSPTGSPAGGAGLGAASQGPVVDKTKLVQLLSNVF